MMNYEDYKKIKFQKFCKIFFGYFKSAPSTFDVYALHMNNSTSTLDIINSNFYIIL